MNVMKLDEIRTRVNALIKQAKGLRGIVDLYNISGTDYVNECGEVYGTAANAALNDLEETIAELKKLMAE